MKNVTLYILILFLPLFYIDAQKKESAINVEAAYVGEVFSNFTGGIKTGQTYLGLMDIGLGFETKNIGLWNNGEFFVMVENTHGGLPTGDFVGDAQVLSNIENGNHSSLYELWYKHQMNQLSLKFGVMDLNAEFHACGTAGYFVNSSFGIMPTASLNMPTPIFPMPALGINFQYDVSDSYSVLGGVWDGDPGDYENNRYNINWSISGDEGYLFIFENHIKYGTATNNNAGTFKVGAMYHSGTFDNLVDTTTQDKGVLEFHIISDHTLITKPEGEKGKLDAFVQLGYAPNNKVSINDLYIGAGLAQTGVLLNSADDVLGLSLAYAGFNNHYSESVYYAKDYEISIELTYLLPLNDHIALQPDFQYIVNPGGHGLLDNAFCGLLRFCICY